jgi:hypothetical protein
MGCSWDGSAAWGSEDTDWVKTVTDDLVKKGNGVQYWGWELATAGVEQVGIIGQDR